MVWASLIVSQASGGFAETLLIYWGLVQLAERQILTLKVKGSSPLPPAKSRSIMDGTIYKTLKTVGRGIRSVHRLKSGPRFSTIPLV